MTLRAAIFAMAALSSFSLSGCADETRANDARVAPRVVSLDYCADQYALKFVDRERLLAVSNEADAPYSYMRAAARGVRRVRPIAEDVLSLKPDIVVRAYGGGPRAAAFFQRAGVEVVQIGYANDIDGVRNIVLETAAALGAAEKGARAVAQMDARLADIAAEAPAAPMKSALYMTPGGVTTGPGSVLHDVMVRAGYENFEAAPGWPPLPLERLAVERPDAVAAGFFDWRRQDLKGWTAARHPIARNVIDTAETTFLDAAVLACAGWFVVDAVEALSDARRAAGAEKAADR
ncbi:MAG: ABC transporter substrate-binding protein [Pseudomonadota bacterium]